MNNEEMPCCHIGCQKDAEFEVYLPIEGDCPEALGTLVCKEHMIKMLDQYDIMHIYRCN